jgi:hypothetical protein
MANMVIVVSLLLPTRINFRINREVHFRKMIPGFLSTTPMRDVTNSTSRKSVGLRARGCENE